MVKKILRWFLAPLTTLLLAVSSSQIITRGYIYSEIGTLWVWSGSAQAWSGSLQGATYTDFKTYLANNGSCGGTSLELITYGAATACAVLYTLESTGISAGDVENSYYSATFNSHTGVWLCTPHSATSNVTWATSGTAQPGTSPFPQSITFSGLTYGGGEGANTSFTLELENPSSSVVQTWTVSSTPYTATYTGGGAEGTWTWVAVVPSPAGACDSTDGITQYPGEATWTGTSYSWYQ